MVDDLFGISKCGPESIALNSFINQEIEMKKLQFHTSNEKGKSKCHKLHVGKKCKECPNLKVHGKDMVEVQSHTYLGDEISNNGKNTENIKSRVSKGIGIVTDILNILKTIQNGHHYFETAVLLRDSMLINGILTNAEAWHNVTKNDVKELGKVDKMFFGKLLEAPFSTPSESFYLEFGILPVWSIIKGRRINFLKYLVDRNQESMLGKVFKVQWIDPDPGDCSYLVTKDLEDLDIDLTLGSNKRYAQDKI